jgi:hypothetical protein
MKIVAALSNIANWARQSEVAYIREENIKLQLIGGCISVVWLDNAGKQGKTCKHLRLQFGTNERMLAYLDENFPSLNDFIDIARSLAQGSVLAHRLPCEMSIENRYSLRVFSPFSLGLLKPLTVVPEKWTMVHVRRALANNQFSDLRCTGRYSDDYAHDSDTNFSRDEKVCALTLLESMVDSHFGWKTRTDAITNEVIIRCFHSDNYRMSLSLVPSDSTGALPN